MMIYSPLCSYCPKNGNCENKPSSKDVPKKFKGTMRFNCAHYKQIYEVGQRVSIEMNTQKIGSRGGSYMEPPEEYMYWESVGEFKGTIHRIPGKYTNKFYVVKLDVPCKVQRLKDGLVDVEVKFINKTAFAIKPIDEPKYDACPTCNEPIYTNEKHNCYGIPDFDEIRAIR
jgi:hypothetical protein